MLLLRINKQLNASINIYLQIERLSPYPKLFKELMRAWSGFILTGEETDEGFDEFSRVTHVYQRLRNSEPIILVK